MVQKFDLEPFFDDYSEDKNFHRILFRPGYAVQARELTQLQTILQEQIRRHGDHMFREGSMIIPGQISYDLDLSYVMLVTVPTVDSTADLDSVVGKEIKNSAGLIGKVIKYSKSETVDGVFHPNTLFVKYQNSVIVGGNNVSSFIPGDFLQVADGSITATFTVAGLNTVTAVPPIGKGCSATIQRGIYYISKNFVLVNEQTIILDKYDNAPTYKIGLQLNEETIYPEEDETLLDNALGTPNYAAPGAARYKMSFALTKLAEGTTTSVEKGFIELLRLKNGSVIFRVDRTQYAEIEKTLARRTYDESGDYTVSPFQIQVKNYRNNLRDSWIAGERYIQGDLIRVASGTNFLYFVAVTSGTAGSTQPTWINYASVDNFVDNTIVWEYITEPSFNNGIYTFAAGDAAFANFTLNDHIRLDGMFVYSIQPGKAYVRGFEIEKISTEYIATQKSRSLPAGSSALATYLGEPSLSAIADSVSSSKTISLDLSMGAYINIEAVSYLPVLTTLPVYRLHSVLKADYGDSNVIGYARVRAIEKNDTAGQYKLFLFDIKMNVGKDFKDVKCITASTSQANSFSCNTIQEGSPAQTVLKNPGDPGLIWDIPDYAVNNISEVSYSVVAQLDGTAAAGTLTLTAPSGYTFESVNDSDNYIISNNVGSIITGATLSLVGGNLVITGLSNVAHTVLATIRRSDAANAQALRTLTDASAIELKSQTGAQVKTITLNHAYVIRVVSVLMSTNAWDTATPTYSVDITNRYEFDFAQDPSAMYLAKLNLRAGSDLPTGPIRIKYEYLSSSENTAGDFLSVGSYTHANSKIRYDQIPTVYAYPLRDSIDFRPYQVTGGNFQARYFPKFGTTGSFKYTNNMSRLDVISLTSTGAFVISRGIPSDKPLEPRTPNNSMKLAQISLEPYTFDRNGQLGAAINRVENKRYTMRDIGKLERRIQDLEYYTALTLSELETKNMQVLDASGNDKFKNGFLVDSFDGQGVGNAASDDWNASIDIQKKELRPFFDQKHVELNEFITSTYASASPTYKVSGDLVTLPFTETPLIIQNKASITENVNPYDLYTWIGVVDINPWSDTWFSTHYRPDVIINDESQYNAIIAKAESDGILGTIWNSWQVVFSSSRSLASRMENLGAWSRANTEILNSSNNGGSFWRATSTFTAEEAAFVRATGAQAGGIFGSRVVTIETSAVETTSSRAGTRSFVVDKVDSRVIEDRVVDTQVVPYIRPRAVLFTGFGFKPSTRIHASFDNILIDNYITPAVRLEVTRVQQAGVNFYPHKFDTTRNAGSAVSSNNARLVNYNDGAPLSGTLTLTQGSTTIAGTSTAFTQQIQDGDFLKLDDTALRYKVVGTPANNTSLTITPAWSGATISGVSAKVIGPRHNTGEVEMAFNHGEVITEMGGNGNTAIVVGQEVFGTKYYIYVLNIKGSGTFSLNANSYLEGEYTVGGLKTRVKFVARTDYTTLSSSDTGLINGVFRIPSNPTLKFATGAPRELRFSSSSSTVPAIRASQETTSGGAFYEAQGLIEVKQRTIVSTRTANIVSEQVSDTNTIVTTNDRLTRDTGWYDPLAQTFLVQQEGGAFITSVDLFFHSRDLKIPVRIEIREVVNGYPGAVIVPFSRVEKKAEEVNVNTSNGTAVTNFKFTSPVFLQNGVEYALVVLADTNNYKIWISQTGTIDVVTEDTIRSQPSQGVLFKSQNGSTWTADQTQDMKYTMYRAQFSQVPVTIEMKPRTLAYKDLAFNPLNMITGSRKCRVEHRNHGMVTGEYVVLKTRQAIESINGINKQYIFDTPLQILSAELDSYVVEFNGTVNSSATGKVGGGFVAASENYEFSTAMVEVGEVVPAGTSISYELKVVNHADEISTYKIVPKENIDFDEVKVYPSEANYNNVDFPSGVSLIATLRPSSTLNSISPVIDLNRLGLTMVSNKIDSPDMSINDSTLDYFTVVGSPGIEIGTGDPIDLIAANVGGIEDTIVIDSAAQATLYNNMNNNLNVGDVLRFTYSSGTDAVRNMVIVEKSIIAGSTSNKLYLLLEGFNGEILADTTAGQTVSIIWLSHFKAEYAAVGGSTHSKYVTKKINFSRTSESLRIMFDAIIPNAADVEIYYKAGLGEAGNFLVSRYYKVTPNSYSKNSTEFRSIEATVEGLSPFDSVIVKLVMKSINKSQVPRIKNFRVIACA